MEVERAWLKKELDKGLGEKGTEAVTAAIADPHLTAARGRELRESVVAYGASSRRRRKGASHEVHTRGRHSLLSARNPEPALMSLAKIAEVAREREVDLIIVAGDLFDAPIRNSDADSMPKLLDACGALLDAAPVVSVQGTPSHDAPGCYEPIVRMGGTGRWLHI